MKRCNTTSKLTLLVDYRSRPATDVESETIARLHDVKRQPDDESTDSEYTTEGEESLDSFRPLISFQLRKSLVGKNSCSFYHHSDSELRYHFIASTPTADDSCSDDKKSPKKSNRISLQEHFDKTTRRENLRKKLYSSKSVQSLGLDSSPLMQAQHNEPIRTTLRRKRPGCSKAQSEKSLQQSYFGEAEDQVSYLPKGLELDRCNRRNRFQREPSFLRGSRIRHFN